MIRKWLPTAVALALGWVVGGFSASSPTAVAQVARITLDSLQRQITRIVDGDTSVGHAFEADHAVTAADSQSLNGRAAADFALATHTHNVSDISGGLLTSAGAGLVAAGSTVGVDFDALDAEYLPLTGGSLSGAIRLANLPSAQRPSAPAVGSIIFNTTIGKPEVFDGAQWVPLY